MSATTLPNEGGSTTASGRKLRILIYGLNFAPELTGVGRYTADMALWLKEQGHDVRVVTSIPYYPEWRVHEGYRRWWWSSEKWNEISLYRCPLWIPARPSALGRLLLLSTFVLASAMPLLWRAVRWRPNVIWTVEPTIIGAPFALAAARLSGSRSWLHVQDIELGAATNLGIIQSGTLVQIARRLYASILKMFDKVSTISCTLRQELAKYGLRERSIQVFRNWVDIAQFAAVARTADLRKSLGISPDEFVCLYSGNIGEKQGVDSLVRSAEKLSHEATIRFVICGEGAAKSRVEKLASSLTNVTFLPLQPEERLPNLLCMADVHLLPQQGGSETFAMPSKFAGMLASRRPIVVQAPTGSELAKLTGESGIVVPVGDGSATAAAIIQLYKQNVRKKYNLNSPNSLTDYDRDVVLGRLEREFSLLVQQHESTSYT